MIDRCIKHVPLFLLLLFANHAHSVPIKWLCFLQRCRRRRHHQMYYRNNIYFFKLIVL